MLYKKNLKYPMKIKSQFTRNIEKNLIKNKIRRKKELLQAAI